MRTMKWFQHRTDSYTNLKHLEIREEFGLEGYGFFWLCCELIGQQGDGYRLKNSKNWLKALKTSSNLSEEKIKKLLQKFAEVGLINSKALEKQELYIPKMKDYSDDYTKRLRTLNEQTTARIDKIRLDKIIQEYITLKAWSVNNELLKEVYKRNVKAAKRLCLIAQKNDIECLRWVAALMNSKGLSWTLETVCNWFPEWEKAGKKSNALKKWEDKYGSKP